MEETKNILEAYMVVLLGEVYLVWIENEFSSEPAEAGFSLN